MPSHHFWNPMVPELIVSQFDESLDFYTSLLGFELRHQRPLPRVAYLDQQGAQLLLSERHPDSWLSGPLQRPYGRGINLKIELADIDPLYLRLKAVNYPLFAELEEHWFDCGQAVLGSREFVLLDPDGYLLRFSQFLGQRG